jgi:predicted Fe-S protein YdhL (DUF1289 family)
MLRGCSRERDEKAAAEKEMKKSRRDIWLPFLARYAFSGHKDVFPDQICVLFG